MAIESSEVAKVTEQLNSDNGSLEWNLKDFQVDKKIGKGQFSEVYRATYLPDGTHAALKKVQVSMRTM